MDGSLLPASATRDLTDLVADMVPAMQIRAAALDEVGAFPQEDIASLWATGALLAAFPRHAGGLGLGSEPAGAVQLSCILRLLGRGHLAVGRLYEAHVNAVRLIARYAPVATVHRAAHDAASGHMIALWVTDPPDGELRATAEGVLHGGKAFCSAAGHVSRAVATVRDATGATRLAYLATEGATATGLEGRLHGMRAACTGRMSFEGCRVDARDWIGGPDDYLHEPDFSAGAWRTSAVTCGGLEALVVLAMDQLVARRRDGDPHQRARMGRAWIAQETASLWLRRGAHAAEGCDPALSAEDIVATVNLARIAIETCCLDAITLVERSLGLGAFLSTNPAERIIRDLATYLRQPAPDEVLDEAAAHVMRRRPA